jgi:hypothetical protein
MAIDHFMRSVAERRGRKQLAAGQEMEMLRQRLAATQEDLHSIIEEQEASNEELQSANEEILSSNEELQSTNEELETAKEELQATNEELTTVNEELQNRNAELTGINNDLINLIASVDIVIIMLSQDLRIRRFTPSAQRVMNLIAGDIGRPLRDINTRLRHPGIESMIAEVIDTMTVKEQDVQDADGRWYSMRVRPYRTVDNKIDGAVLALVEIDELKRLVQSAAIAFPSISGGIRPDHRPGHGGEDHRPERRMRESLRLDARRAARQAGEYARPPRPAGASPRAAGALHAAGGSPQRRGRPLDQGSQAPSRFDQRDADRGRRRGACRHGHDCPAPRQAGNYLTWRGRGQPGIQCPPET